MRLRHLLSGMKMITPGIAGSLTPRGWYDKEPRRRGAAAHAGWRLRLPHVRLHLPHPHLPHLRPRHPQL